MAITLSELCKGAEKKYNMHIVAGKSGLGNTVRWVHMVEDRQVPEFLHGNELIFTTGIGHIGKGGLQEFIVHLKEHGAVGIVVNIGPYIREIPPDAADYCEREGFPLFTLPWNIYIIDITYDFCRIIIENEKIEFSAAETFKNIIKYPGSPEVYASALDRMGFRTDSLYRVEIIGFFRDEENVNEQLGNKISMKLWSIIAKSPFPSAMFILDGRTVVIHQNSSDEERCVRIKQLGMFMRAQEIICHVGISDLKRGYASVHELYSEAKAAYAMSVISQKSPVFYNDTGINKILFGVENKMILKNFADDTVGKLTRYDAENNTDYTSLLRRYLECSGSVNSVASAENIHRNTVNSKIRQIKTILGYELSEEKKAELILAFHINDILKFLNN